MGDVHGGLLKCVLQLAACSDKLRTTDVLLGKFVATMQQDLPLDEIPTLKATLAVVPIDPESEARTKEHIFEDAFERGTEASERLEMTKARLEKELERRSENFQAIVTSRNTDIQEEYERMLQELEDQADALTHEITAERAAKRSAAKRRSDAAETDALHKKRRSDAAAETERRVLMHEIDEHTREIRDLQREFAQLEALLERADDDARAIAQQSDDDQRAVAEQRVRHEIAELQQEIALLDETQQAIADAQQTSSLKTQYEEEIAAIDEEVAHTESVYDETATQLSSSSARMHGLLRSLAPSPSIGLLMTRLYQQLTHDRSSTSSTSSSSSSSPPTSDTTTIRKTVDLQAFLNSCPSADEGKQAIDEMKKLQLIYCYESSGIIALAD